MKILGIEYDRSELGIRNYCSNIYSRILPNIEPYFQANKLENKRENF